MQIIPYEKRGYDLLHSGMIAFSQIQQNGVRVDVDYCKKQMKKIDKQIQDQKEKVFEYKEIKTWKKIYKSEFNLDSNDQLKDVLFTKLKYKSVSSTKKGNPSTDKNALEALKLPFTEDLLQYRRLLKMQNTYMANVIKEVCDRYIHSFINLHIATTFRSSMDSLNLQNQPIRDPEIGSIIRRCFIPRENHRFVDIDFGGIETRGAGWETKDPTLLKYLRNPDTSDMHADFMSQIYFLKDYDLKHKGDKTLRKGTKNGFTFPQFYGDYYGNNAISLWNWAQLHTKKLKGDQGLVISNGKTIAQHLIDSGIEHFVQFESHIKDIEKFMWEESFPVYKEWKNKKYKEYLKKGYIKSLSGFVFQGMMGKNDATNYPIQSICFHCLLWSIIRINKILRKKKMRSKVVFQVHDSIMADVHKDEFDDYLDIAKKVMCHDLKEHWDWIITPLAIEGEASEINGSWAKMKTAIEYSN